MPVSADSPLSARAPVSPQRELVSKFHSMKHRPLGQGASFAARVQSPPQSVEERLERLFRCTAVGSPLDQFGLDRTPCQPWNLGPRWPDVPKTIPFSAGAGTCWLHRGTDGWGLYGFRAHRMLNSETMVSKTIMVASGARWLARLRQGRSIRCARGRAVGEQVCLGEGLGL